MTASDIVVNMVKLHDGELIGRTRLQKEAYLLDRCGAEFQVEFVYHYYGPYSFELADGIQEACSEQRIVTYEEAGRYGIDYTRFNDIGANTPPMRTGGLSFQKAKALIERMNDDVTDIVLELAATIVYLRNSEGFSVSDAVDETKARKPHKANEVRIEKATQLLKDLGLITA